MKDDLKLIKKKYGEKMMQLCRDLFATILENSPGTLYQIIINSFSPTRSLYDDLKDNIPNFKDYIFSIYSKLKENNQVTKKQVEDPVTLMKKAGYNLYECKCDRDIQKFRKYYTPEEELCTFKYGDRLRSCYVYFAVLDNVEEIKREDFQNPKREDKYGTSVISIQFTKDGSHTLSIKNRYNHTVKNPDATFSNNLDNIIPGLTQSFEDYYGMKQYYKNVNYFELPGYTRANDGKFYKYNYEINNIYYCPNNIIIDNFQPKKHPSEKYIIMDYFILDLVNKKFINNTEDSFPETIGNIKNISIKNDQDLKIIVLTQEDNKDIIITLDKFNKIISLRNNNTKIVPDKFMIYNNSLKELVLNNVEIIGDQFLLLNKTLNKLELNSVKNIGLHFLFNCTSIKKLSLPNVEVINDGFMINSPITEISLPKVIYIGNKFLCYNNALKILNLPNVKSIGDEALCYNNELISMTLPNIEKIGASFLETNGVIEVISLPKIKNIGSFFFYSGDRISKIYMPNIEKIGDYFICYNKIADDIKIPDNAIVGEDFMRKNNNSSVKEIRKKNSNIKKLVR